jgi:hypothetical protein
LCSSKMYSASMVLMFSLRHVHASHVLGVEVRLQLVGQVLAGGAEL